MPGVRKIAALADATVTQQSHLDAVERREDKGQRQRLEYRLEVGLLEQRRES